MLEDMMNGMRLVNSIYGEAKGLSHTSFFSMLAVLIDNYCADHGEDPVEEAATLAAMIKEVNQEFGPMSRQENL